MTDEAAPSLSFGSVADAYDRGRPSYPIEAARWLTGQSPVSVLELGAGTGKLTTRLVELGHDVHATEPDRAMLDVLEHHLPGVRASQGSAEKIPVVDRSVDVVVCAQAFHWFDLEQALPEIARVLKPGGQLALVWNQRDERIPWVRRFGEIIGNQDQVSDPAEQLVASHLFGFVEDATFRFRQTIDSRSVQDLVLSRSNVAVLDEEERAAKLAEVSAFYDDYGRGMDGMQLPYATRCFRATLVPGAVREDPVEEAAVDDEPAPAARGGYVGEDTEMLLIDFH